MKLWTSLLLLCSASLAAPAQTYLCGTPHSGSVVLRSDSVYSASAAGFDLKTAPEVTAGSCFSTKPFFFSASVPEGSYRVTVELGSPTASVVTVRAEARRLMVEKTPVPAGKSIRRTFDVNIRVPRIAGNKPGSVKLKPREVGNADWDTKLTLEFNGDHPGFRSIRIEPVHEPTIYLAGDSTVVDQDVEPWAAWGQMLPRFFRPGIVVANHAESGETTRSFESEHRFAKIFSLIQPGDYLFFQFGHNDQKPANNVPLDLYKKLLATYIDKARAARATPVLVTSMFRRNFDANGKIADTMAGYPEAMRAVASEKSVALIDLNAMSRTLFEAMGPETSMKAFMHYPVNSFPGQTEAISDDTHFNSYGAYELARCVAHGIREAKLPLAKMLIKDEKFDPAHPDPQPSFNLPFTPIPPKDGDVTKVPQI
ncbi:MAG: rhamnogalacturonan acetylesterase [Chthoniobacter sp.]|nr:rhamnogalacturonan acetylesterase [Chthoniobacter sp.]